METFISLEEFMLLRDPHDRPEHARPLGHIGGAELASGHDPGRDIIDRYRLAKASWERFGDAGPPIGTEVVTLVSGHGGGPGCRRTFAGRYDSDPRFFTLSRKDRDKTFVSIVNVVYWWTEIATVDMFEPNARGRLIIKVKT